MTEETEFVEEAREAEAEEQTPTSVNEDEEVNEEYDGTDYSQVVENDLAELRARFPELASIGSITELDNPLRFAELRDLGLSVDEAYLATSKRRVRTDNRRHLTSTVPIGTIPDREIPRGELERARQMFSGLSDKEIRSLYRRVTK